jgi:hypothetical protein
VRFHYVPLLQILRELQERPHGLGRFRKYLHAVLDERRRDLDLTPLVMANPMARDHVTARLDALLALDADRVARETLEEAASRLVHVPGSFRAGLTIVDDAGGGWTNRWATELGFRRHLDPRSPRFWITGVLWSTEDPTERSVRNALATACHRAAMQLLGPPPSTLDDMLRQEGETLRRAEATAPTLDPEDIAYTREVLAPLRQATDHATLIAALFGDRAATSLGHAPLGLSSFAGLALACEEARARPRGPDGLPLAPSLCHDARG